MCNCTSLQNERESVGNYIEVIYCIHRLFILHFRLRNSDHELTPVSVCSFYVNDYK